MFADQFLDGLKSIFVFNRRRIYIDNVSFRLHYVWTVALLIVFILLVTSKIFIEDPINCLASQELQDIVKPYCYIHSTFTRGRFDKGTWYYEPARENEIYPGVRPGVTGDQVTVHSYYQWVWLVFSVQAVAFYFPHWVWLKLEQGTTMMLVADLNLPMLSDEKKLKHRRKILLYLRRNRGHHQKYALSYSLAEVGNLINIVTQLIITDHFLDNAFSTYGLNVFTLTQSKPYQRDDKLARVFPTVTACRLATGGVAFGKVQHDILCVLPINILNEKLYIVLWFWLILILVSTLLGLVYRVLVVRVMKFRAWMMRRKLRQKLQRESADNICLGSNYGEWFLIYKLSQNMDPVTFGDLIEDIDEAFRKWDRTKSYDEDSINLTPPPPSATQSPVHVKLDYLRV